MPRGSTCKARGCTANKNDNPELSFHSFPKNKERFKLWCNLIKRPDLLHGKAIPSRMSMRVCSLHFEDRMYMSPTNKSRLIWCAVPKPVDAEDVHGEPPSGEQDQHMEACIEPFKTERERGERCEGGELPKTVEASTMAPSLIGTEGIKKYDLPLPDMEEIEVKEESLMDQDTNMDLSDTPSSPQADSPSELFTKVGILGENLPGGGVEEMPESKLFQNLKTYKAPCSNTSVKPNTPLLVPQSQSINSEGLVNTISQQSGSFSSVLVPGKGINDIKEKASDEMKTSFQKALDIKQASIYHVKGEPVKHNETYNTVSQPEGEESDPSLPMDNTVHCSSMDKPLPSSTRVSSPISDASVHTQTPQLSHQHKTVLETTGNTTQIKIITELSSTSDTSSLQTQKSVPQNIKLLPQVSLSQQSLPTTKPCIGGEDTIESSEVQYCQSGPVSSGSPKHSSDSSSEEMLEMNKDEIESANKTEKGECEMDCECDKCLTRVEEELEVGPPKSVTRRTYSGPIRRQVVRTRGGGKTTIMIVNKASFKTMQAKGLIQPLTKYMGGHQQSVQPLKGKRFIQYASVKPNYLSEVPPSANSISEEAPTTKSSLDLSRQPSSTDQSLVIPCTTPNKDQIIMVPASIAKSAMSSGTVPTNDKSVIIPRPASSSDHSFVVPSTATSSDHSVIAPSTLSSIGLQVLTPSTVSSIGLQVPTSSTISSIGPQVSTPSILSSIGPQVPNQTHDHISGNPQTPSQDSKNPVTVSWSSVNGSNALSFTFTVQLPPGISQPSGTVQVPLQLASSPVLQSNTSHGVSQPDVQPQTHTGTSQISSSHSLNLDTFSNLRIESSKNHMPAFPATSFISSKNMSQTSTVSSLTPKYVMQSPIVSTKFPLVVQEVSADHLQQHQGEDGHMHGEANMTSDRCPSSSTSPPENVPTVTCAKKSQELRLPQVRVAAIPCRTNKGGVKLFRLCGTPEGWPLQTRTSDRDNVQWIALPSSQLRQSQASLTGTGEQTQQANSDKNQMSSVTTSSAVYGSFPTSKLDQKDRLLHIPPSYKSANKQLKKKYISLLNKHRQRYHLLLKKYKALEDQISVINDVGTPQQVIRDARNFLSDEHVLFLESQMFLRNRPGTGNRFSRKFMRLMIEYYKRSAAGYRFLRTIFTIPSVKTIQKWLSKPVEFRNFDEDAHEDQREDSETGYDEASPHLQHNRKVGNTRHNYDNCAKFARGKSLDQDFEYHEDSDDESDSEESGMEEMEIEVHNAEEPASVTETMAQPDHNPGRKTALEWEDETWQRITS